MLSHNLTYAATIGATIGFNITSNGWRDFPESNKGKSLGVNVLCNDLDTHNGAFEKEDGKNMSLAAIAKSKHGIVLATESRLTWENANERTLLSDDGVKIYYSKKLNIGITCVGIQKLANYDRRNWLDVVKGIENIVNDSAGFLRALQFVVEDISNQNTQFLVADNNNKMYYYTNRGDKLLREGETDCKFQGELDYANLFVHNNDFVDNSLMGLVKHLQKAFLQTIKIAEFAEVNFGYYRSFGGLVHMLVMPNNASPYWLEGFDGEWEREYIF